MLKSQSFRYFRCRLCDAVFEKGKYDYSAIEARCPFRATHMRDLWGNTKSSVNGSKLCASSLVSQFLQNLNLQEKVDVLCVTHDAQQNTLTGRWAIGGCARSASATVCVAIMHVHDRWVTVSCIEYKNPAGLKKAFVHTGLLPDCSREPTPLQTTSGFKVVYHIPCKFRTRQRMPARGANAPVLPSPNVGAAGAFVMPLPLSGVSLSVSSDTLDAAELEHVLAATRDDTDCGRDDADTDCGCADARHRGLFHALGLALARSRGNLRAQDMVRTTKSRSKRARHTQVIFCGRLDPSALLAQHTRCCRA